MCIDARRYLFLLAILLIPANTAGSENVGFVHTDGPTFVLNGDAYYFVGANFWYGLSLASAGPGGDRGRLERELDALSVLGITNLRIMAGSEGPDSEPWRSVPSLQPEPGVYNPDVLDGLDFLLAEMNERDLRAVMCLTNFWQWSGGMAQYVSWNGGGPIPYPPPEPGGDWNTYQDYASDFYSNEGAMDDLRNHIAFLIDRENPYTGTRYGEDPTIMAWELANEPRGFNNNAAAFNVWIDETAAFIKSLDDNHLVTTGCEGDTPWPTWNGLDFVANHDGPDIDYATFHIWPENWGWYDPADPEGTFATALASADSYFAGHVATAKTVLGKPVALEEFGLARDGGSYDPGATVSWRDAFLGAVFDEVYESALSGGPCAGDNFWAWAGEGRPQEPYGGYWEVGDPWTGDPPHERQGWYSVYDADTTTLSLLGSHAANMASLVQTGVVDPSEADAHGDAGHLRVYPSPAHGSLTITARPPAGCPGAVVRIVDVRGRIVWRSRVGAEGADLSWPDGKGWSPAVPSGVYFVIMKTPLGLLSAKIVYVCASH
jgi:mannan endo-1,4-beta-mannosidase